MIAPHTEEALARYRHSIVFFGVPDYYSTLAPIDGIEPEEGRTEETLQDHRPFGEIIADILNKYTAGKMTDYKDVIN